MAEETKLMELRYRTLSEVMDLKYKDNAKLHNAGILSFSVGEYGFNDPFEIGYWLAPDGTMHEMLVSGHGRADTLSARKAEGKEIPPRIGTIMDENGVVTDWTVPTIPIPLENENQAILYAVYANRAGAMHLAADDYDTAKLKAALVKAGGDNQSTLPGFTDQDLSYGAVMDPAFQSPALQPFDIQGVQGTPQAIQDSAPVSFVMMVTFPTFMDMQRATAMFTLNRRKTIPADSRMVSINGAEYLEQWGAILSPKQITVAVDPALVTLEPIVVAEEEPVEMPAPWDLAGQSEALAATVAAKKAKPVAENKIEPSWGGDLCTRCGALGYIKSPSHVCPACLGHKTKDKYLVAMALLQTGAVS